MTLLLREADVRGLLAMPDAVRWVEEALRAHGLARARNLPRQRVKLPKGTLHVLPAADLERSVVGLKTYTTFRGGTRFLVLLYSADDGRLLALLEADYLGMMRTGAASGVATRYLARPDANVLAVFGTGWQARGQLQAVATVRPLRQVRVFGRDPARRRGFTEEMAALVPAEIVPCESPTAALDGAGIVVTATTASSPLFPSGAVETGAHINAVGSNSLLRRELDEELIRRASLVVVDSREQARVESGDLLIPAERGWLDWEQLPELGEVVAGKVVGRRQAEEITIFESHGIGLEDIAVAAEVYRLAQEQGLGETLNLFGELAPHR